MDKTSGHYKIITYTLGWHNPSSTTKRSAVAANELGIRDSKQERREALFEMEKLIAKDRGWSSSFSATIKI